MELGTYRLAEINKGGGLRQKAVGLATQYLNGIGQWVDMPTAMTPTAHNHAASEIGSGTLELARLPRIAAGSIYVGAGTSNDILTLAKGSALQALRTNAAGAALEWYTTPWKDGIGTGAIMTKNATAAGLRSGDGAKPYVYWDALSGQDLKAGGLAGTDQKWMLISPSTVATYAYGGVEYTYNNATANYVFLLLIDSSDFIGSDTSPFNRCRIIANAGTNYLISYSSVTFVGTPITGNVYPVIVTTGSSTAPSGINYTESVSLYAPLKSSSTNYAGNYSVASGRYSVASGNYSVASGITSVASGYASVASGWASVASGYASVALGYLSVASGESSVASGLRSVASGESSVASGYYSVASGRYSVASGNYSVASGESQTVIGKYNVADTSSAFIIGNGTSTSARSNCMTVDFNGNMTLAGALTLSNRAGDNRIAYFDSAGILQSSASYTLSSFASATHNHDATYLKLSGGTMTGAINLGSTGGIYKSGWDGNRIAYFVSGDLTTSSEYTLSSFASAGHNHDSAYSAIDHDHSGTYASTSHNHDSAYSAIGHDHSGVYSLAGHTHSGYATSTHNHDVTYLKLSGGILTGKITLDTNGGIFKSGWDGNRIAYFVSGDLTTSADYTLSSFASAGHNHDGVYSPNSHTHSGYAASTHTHSIPDLYCGVANIVPGRILISGSGGSSNPTWLDAGTNGKILGWTSGAPAWVDAPSGSSVTAANPTASVGLTAVNGSATTFMRSDAAPKLDVSIAPTWTGNHTFSGLTRLATVGIGVAPSTAYKLYIVEDKEITTEGSYFGNCLIAKYNTTLTSGTRQGIALLGQLWAKGGTLSHAKGLDFKVYVSSGTVQEATAINAVIQTDGGSIETAYALKLSRSGTAPTVANYGIYQEDSAATNVFNGYCEFNGGTNLATGRVRNFSNLSASATLTPAAGTDLLVFFETSSSATQTLTFPATNMTGRAGDIIRVVLSGQCKLTFSTGSGNLLIKPAYYGATANYYLTTQSTTGDWTFICDGTYWRAQMLSQLYE